MKKLVFFLCVIASSITSNAQVPNYVPTDGLVGYWSFTGNANDESGNGNNGTVNGATLVDDRFGNPSSAYYFDGIDNNITTSVSYPSDNAPKSFSCWVKFDDVNDRGWVLGNNVGCDQGGLTESGFGLFHDNGNVSFHGDGSGPDVSFSNTFNQTEYYHFAVSFDGTTINCYLNGVLNSRENNTLSTAIANFVIGSRSDIPDDGSCAQGEEWFMGYVDDIGIWDRALTEVEVLALYQSCNLTVDVNLVQGITCVNGNNGEVSVTNVSGGDSPYTYVWSNAETTESISGLMSGTYDVTVTDMSGCLSVNAIIISEPNEIQNGYDTATYFVNDLTFESISPVIYLDSTEYLFSINGCDSVSYHYSEFIYNATYCSDTIQVLDTTFVSINDTTFISVTDTLFIDVALGISPNTTLNTIKVFPNPTATHIYIDNGEYAAMGGYSIRIENSLGQAVFEEDITQQQFYIDLSGWSGNGTYFVNIIDPSDNIVDVRKVILN